MSEVIFNSKNKPIVLWGGGRRTRQLLENQSFDFTVEFIIDSDIEKDQTMICGVKTVLPQTIEELEKYFVIVIPQKYQTEIFSILSERNMQHTLDYIGLSELLDFYRREYKKQLLDDVSNGYHVMVMPTFPIGDICMIISLLKPYKEKMDKPLAIYTESRKNRDLLRLSPEADKVETLCMGPILFKEDDLFENESILDVTNIFAVFKSQGDRYCDTPGAIKVFLGLPESAKCNKIKNCTFGCTESVEDVFREYKLKKGKTVFIVPYGDWLGKQVVTEEFWNKLCKALVKEGYSVIFNAEKEIVSAIPSVFLDVLNVPLFAEMCGNVVGARTGLLNYIAYFTDVMIQAIWPGEDNPRFSSVYWKNWCEFGGVDLSRRSDYYIEKGYSIRHETKREQKLIEFIHEEDEKDIAFILDNLDKQCKG